MNRTLRHLRRFFFLWALIYWTDTLLTHQERSGLVPINTSQAAFQDPLDEPDTSSSAATKKFREMAKPEAKAKAQADLERPPFEFLRSQLSPFDVLPFYKHNHWMFMTIEARSSREDFSGSVRTQPLSLFGSQRDVIFERSVNLERNTPTRMSFPLFVPPQYMPQRQTKIFDLDLYRTAGLRPTEIWKSNVRAMEPHQMAVVILANNPSLYSGWSKLMAGIPSSVSRDSISVEKGRYYRFVLPENPEKPLLAPSFLFWTNISHLIWDGFDPNVLDVDQQRALVDWLHWGGQITILGGADSRLGLLRESILAPYLPADQGGTNKQLGSSELKPLALAYRPPYRAADTLNEEDVTIAAEDNDRVKDPRWAMPHFLPHPYYDPPAPIITPARNPLFVTGLQPRPGATVITLGEDASTILAVEQRVGRGRITILAINPTEPSITRWRGLDTLVRRIILRRPEEVRQPPRMLSGMEPRAPLLSGPELTWLRITARDVGGPIKLDTDETERMANQPFLPAPGSRSIQMPEELVYPREEVATWIDSATIPTLAREQLEAASGITIPAFSFVAKALLAYLILLVPLNWVVFRVAGRRELAWVAVPLLAIVTAVTIERLAAYDLGFARGRDEIALLEMQSDYSRGHLSRFGAMAATGRDTFNIAFPNDLNAVCLPQSYQASRAEQSETSNFSYTPMPTLGSFQVQPRSISYYRSEQMVGLPGPIRMLKNGDDTIIENRTKLNLHDVTVTGPENARIVLGELGAGASRSISNPIDPPQASAPVARKEIMGKLDPQPFVDILVENPVKSYEDESAWRLTGWSDTMIEGVQVEPAPDRVRGFTLVVVNLKSGDAPNPSDRIYNRFAFPPEEEAARQARDAEENSIMQPAQPRLPGPLGSKLMMGILKSAGVRLPTQVPTPPAVSSKKSADPAKNKSNRSNP